MIRSGVDLYMLYSIVRRIARPFREWEAYRLGVIDDKGNFLIPKEQRTPEQYYSLTYLDIFVLNLKKILGKVPGLNNRFVTYAAALWLIREDRYQKMDVLTEEGEAMPANNISSGNIATSSEKEAKAFKRAARLKRKKQS